MNLKKSSLDWGLWFWWSLTTVVGWAGGWAITMIWTFRGDWVTGHGFGAYAVPGVMVGTMQWLVLRRRVPRSGWWILVSAVGMATVSYARQIIWMYAEHIAVFGAVFGGIIGITQWSVMRRWVHRAGWWVLANTIGWTLGWWFAAPARDLTGFLVDIGGIAGIITGFALAMLFRHSVQQAPFVQGQTMAE